MPEKSGILGSAPRNSSPAKAKGPNLLAVETELDGLHGGSVGLHGNLNDDPGLTEVRFGPLLAKLVIKIGCIAYQHVNVQVVAAFAGNQLIIGWFKLEGVAIDFNLDQNIAEYRISAWVEIELGG